MKKVYTCNNHIDLNGIKFQLDANDIQYLVKNEYSQSITGEVPFSENWPEVWVTNLEQVKKAADLCLAFEQSNNQELPEWQCAFCDEINEGSFEVCWNCQGVRPE